MRISELKKSIAWNLFGVPLLVMGVCAVAFGVTSILLYSVFGTITRRTAEANTVAFALYGLVSGIYGGGT